MKNKIKVTAGGVKLNGDLFIPADSKAIIVFVHGSGSSRLSPRNKFIADGLQKAGFAAFLFDLLTAEEEIIDDSTFEYRFDIDLLSGRLNKVAEWIAGKYNFKKGIGYFGASTGAAAALISAAKNPKIINAVVSRGGRTDLATDEIENVRAPTLLIAGGFDPAIIAVNQQTFSRLKSEKKLTIIPGAGHLFEERGALEKVAENAVKWFKKYLS